MLCAAIKQKPPIIRDSRSGRRLLVALSWLFLIIQGPSVANADPRGKPAPKDAAGYSAVRYRHHTAECRYFTDPAMDIVIVATKTVPTSGPRVASSLISCLEPRDMQWT
jgi:hypothetical protein